MIAQPLVSVVVPTRNRNDLLPRCLRSIQNQNYQNLEVLVVDDSPTGEARNVVQEFSAPDPRFRYVHGTGKGAPSARNLGITQAKGEYVAFLDDDDEWMPTKLAEQIALMSARGLSVSFTGAYICEFSGKPFFISLPPRTGCGRAKLLTRAPYVFSTCVVRAGVFEVVGRFDEKLKSHQDLDLYIRLACHYRFGSVRRPLVRYYQNPKSITGSTSHLAGWQVIHQKYQHLIDWRVRAWRAYYRLKGRYWKWDLFR